jgi:UDP-N-acetyl-2-amino-2-deoxyglucuronate dehydrogenase
MNFAIIGVAGYIAPRHLRAIRDTGNQLVAAIDPHDSVGLLDQYAYDVQYFSEMERFDRYLEKLRQENDEKKVDYVSICSPNYLHDIHCREAMRLGANVICEKPLVVNSWNLDAIEEVETETGCKVNAVLQLRLHSKIKELRKQLGSWHKVKLTWITARGNWYHNSWKGNLEKSGGLITNIGVHLFDMLIWLFGMPGGTIIVSADAEIISGFTEFEKARVQWYLSINPHEMPSGTGNIKRSMIIDNEKIDFTDGFTDLHTCVYEEVLAGRGFGIKDARPSIELVQKIREGLE